MGRYSTWKWTSGAFTACAARVRAGAPVYYVCGSETPCCLLKRRQSDRCSSRSMCACMVGKDTLQRSGHLGAANSFDRQERCAASCLFSVTELSCAFSDRSATTGTDADLVCCSACAHMPLVRAVLASASAPCPRVAVYTGCLLHMLLREVLLENWIFTGLLCTSGVRVTSANVARARPCGCRQYERARDRF